MLNKIIIISIIVLLALLIYQISESQNIKINNNEKYIIDPSELVSGGPGKGGIGQEGGIPALDMPDFITSSEASISSEDIIIGINYNNTVKAYPIKILQYHEIVNDFAGDIPIIVTYCPLCKSGVAFESTIEEERVRFGVSGKLYNSNLVMYDEKTESYWNQLTGQAIIGDLTGTNLKRIPVSFTTWDKWEKRYPETLILSENTGFSRQYNILLYENYFADSSNTFGTKYDDKRLEPKEIIYPVEILGKFKAYPENSLEEDVIDQFNGKYVIIVKDAGIRIFTGDTKPGNTSIEYLTNNYDEYGTFTAFWFSWIAFKPETEVYSDI